MIHTFKQYTPKIHSSCYIADNSTIIGNVDIEEDCSVWFGAVIRGDASRIILGSGTNIQDNATVHGDEGYDVCIGKGVSIGHNAIVHGAYLEDNVLVGMGAIIMNGVRIGRNSIIAAGAVVKENQVIPENSLVVGVPAKVVRTLTPEQQKSIKLNASIYMERAKEYMK